MAVPVQKITWGTAFANTFQPRLPFHRPMPRGNWVGETAEATSGVVDAWEEGHHEELEFEFRYIPPQTTGTYTGWFGAAGGKAFVLAARRGEPFRVYMDKDLAPYHDVQAVPGSIQEDREDSKAQFYRLRMRVRDLAGAGFEV